MPKFNARDYLFEVSTDPTATTPVWAQVGGLSSFSLSPSANGAQVDTTDFDSDGNYEGQAMQRGATLQLQGQRKYTGTPATLDAGQAACDALAQEVGESSLGGVRFRHTEETSWEVWTAYAESGDKGGGNNDKTSFAVTFTRSGAKTSATVTP